MIRFLCDIVATGIHVWSCKNGPRLLRSRGRLLRVTPGLDESQVLAAKKVWGPWSGVDPTMTHVDEFHDPDTMELE